VDLDLEEVKEKKGEEVLTHHSFQKTCLVIIVMEKNGIN
jgi:hypothetical protein